MRMLCALASLICWLYAVAPGAAQEGSPVTVPAGALRLQVDATGHIVSALAGEGGRELMPAGRRSPVLALVLNGRLRAPIAATWSDEGKRLELGYGDGISALVAVEAKPSHLRLEVVEVCGADPDRVEWGPLYSTLTKTVGETVCVARDDDWAVGLQSLCLQNVAGAGVTDGVAVLHAYATRHEGGWQGSSVALFGCRADQALETIGQIELAEGLPHPDFDGVWSKVSPKASASYLISEFGEADLEDHLRLTHDLGFEHLYSMSAFATWGHFLLDRGRFPEGEESMRRCVQRAAAQGITLGAHTLTAFITTNDPYVTPVPDLRLARLGSSVLTGAVDAAATEIPVRDPEPFRARQTWGWSRKQVILGQEIVQYEDVVQARPWKLVGCERGKFGTTASEHAAGADIGRLATHDYGTFYPGIENGMMQEMALGMARVFRETGMAQTSFDGLEGLTDYGWPGDYTRNLFVKLVCDNWPQHQISDASNLVHWTWHLQPRMNWGEPWGKAMREGQLEGRLRNQGYFDRNLYPHMLGWFEFRPGSRATPATSLDDVEWMLAKAAAFNAGFALVTHPGVMRVNGYREEVCRAVVEWEKARRAGAFSAEQRKRMEEPLSDWHLEPAEGGGWWLWPVTYGPAVLSRGGEGPGTEWTEVKVDNPYPTAGLRFVLRMVDAPPQTAAGAFEFEVGGQSMLVQGGTIGPGQWVVYEGGDEAEVRDCNWNLVQKLRVEGQAPTLPAGESTLRFSCQVWGETLPEVEVRVKLVGAREEVGGA